MLLYCSDFSITAFNTSSKVSLSQLIRITFVKGFYRIIYQKEPVLADKNHGKSVEVSVGAKRPKTLTGDPLFRRGKNIFRFSESNCVIKRVFVVIAYAKTDFFINSSVFGALLYAGSYAGKRTIFKNEYPRQRYAGRNNGEDGDLDAIRPAVLLKKIKRRKILLFQRHNV